MAGSQIFIMQKVVQTCSEISRIELAHTVRELLDWKRPSGGLKARECRDLLTRLQRMGYLNFPEKREVRLIKNKKAVSLINNDQTWSSLSGSVESFAPVEFELVRERDQRQLFRELVERYHYLGYKTPFGAQLQYLAYVSRPRRQLVGCIQFSSPAWRIKARDKWIGWDDSTRGNHLQHVVNNSRFLVLARIRNLSGMLLSGVLRQLRSDWQAQYNLEPWRWRKRL